MNIKQKVQQSDTPNKTVYNKQRNIDEENQKADTIFKKMLELLDKSRRLTKVGLKVKEVNETIEKYDREKAIFLIAQNVNKYEKLINLLSCITGRYVIYEPDYYADKTDEIIFCDLKYIRNVIYFDEIKNTGLEMTLTKALKKLNIID